MSEKGRGVVRQNFFLKSLWSSFIALWLVVNLLFLNFDYYFLELCLIVTIAFYINIYLFVKEYWIKKGDEINDLKKYKNLRISVTEEEEILAKVQNLFENDKIYQDAELTLPKVASYINISSHKLSCVINGNMKMTFNEFINHYRVNEIKKLLLLPQYQDMKISNFAFDYGFNSISTFNTAFKKVTGRTPSQYRQEKMQGVLN